MLSFFMVQQPQITIIRLLTTKIQNYNRYHTKHAITCDLKIAVLHGQNSLQGITGCLDKTRVLTQAKPVSCSAHSSSEKLYHFVIFVTN